LRLSKLKTWSTEQGYHRANEQIVAASGAANRLGGPSTFHCDYTLPPTENSAIKKTLITTKYGFPSFPQ